MALTQIGGKVDESTKALFTELQEKSDANTFSQFIDLLLEAYGNPKTKEVTVARPTAEQQAEIDQLNQEHQNEIGRLQTAHSLELDKRDTNAAALLQQLETLSSQPAPQFTPAPGQILVTLEPLLVPVLAREIEIAAKQSGQPVTAADYLADNFKMAIFDGRAYPYKVWSKDELLKIKKQLENPTA